MQTITFIKGQTGSGKTSRHLQLIKFLPDISTKIIYVCPRLESKIHEELGDRNNTVIYGDLIDDMISGIAVWINSIERRKQNLESRDMHLHLAIDDVDYVKKLTESHTNIWNKLNNVCFFMRNINASYSATLTSTKQSYSSVSVGLSYQLIDLDWERDQFSHIMKQI